MPTKQIRLNSIKTRKNSLYNSKTKNFSKTRKIIGGSKTVSRTSKKCLYRGKTMKGGSGKFKTKFGNAVSGVKTKIGTAVSGVKNMFGHSKRAPVGVIGTNPFGSDVVHLNPLSKQHGVQILTYTGPTEHGQTTHNPLYEEDNFSGTGNKANKFKGRTYDLATEAPATVYDFATPGTFYDLGASGNPNYAMATGFPAKKAQAPYYSLGASGNPNYAMATGFSAKKAPVKYYLGAAAEGPAPVYDFATSGTNEFSASPYYSLASSQTNPNSLYHTFTGKDRTKTVFENPGYMPAGQGPVKYDLATDHPDKVYQVPGQKKGAASSPVYAMAAGTPKVPAPVTYDLATDHPDKVYQVPGQVYKKGAASSPDYVIATGFPAEKAPVTYDLATDHPDKVYQVPGQKKGAASSPVYAMAAGTPKVPAPVTYDLGDSGNPDYAMATVTKPPASPYYSLGASGNPVYDVVTGFPVEKNPVTYDTGTMPNNTPEYLGAPLKLNYVDVRPNVNATTVVKQTNVINPKTVVEPVKPVKPDITQNLIEMIRVVHPHISTIVDNALENKIDVTDGNYEDTKEALKTLKNIQPETNLGINPEVGIIIQTLVDSLEKNIARYEDEIYPYITIETKQNKVGVNPLLPTLLNAAPQTQKPPPTTQFVNPFLNPQPQPPPQPPQKVTPPTPLKAAPPPPPTPLKAAPPPTKVTQPAPPKQTSQTPTPTPPLTQQTPQTAPLKTTPPTPTPPQNQTEEEPGIAIEGENNTPFTKKEKYVNKLRVKTLNNIIKYNNLDMHTQAQQLFPNNNTQREKAFINIMKQIEDMKTETEITDLQNQINIISKIQPQGSREGFNKAANLSKLKHELKLIKQLNLPSTEKKKQILQKYNRLNDTHSKLLETVIAKSKFSNLTEFNKTQTEVLKTEYLKALQELQKRRVLKLHTKEYANNLFKKHMTERPSHH